MASGDGSSATARRSSSGGDVARVSQGAEGAALAGLSGAALGLDAGLVGRVDDGHAQTGEHPIEGCGEGAGHGELRLSRVVQARGLDAGGVLAGEGLVVVVGGRLGDVVGVDHCPPPSTRLSAARASAWRVASYSPSPTSVASR